MLLRKSKHMWIKKCLEHKTFTTIYNTNYCHKMLVIKHITKWVTSHTHKIKIFNSLFDHLQGIKWLHPLHVRMIFLWRNFYFDAVISNFINPLSLWSSNFANCFPFLISDACSPGSWSNTGLPPCVECDIGYYEDTYGSTGCSKCPGNLITVTESSTTISKCIGEKLCLIFSTFLVEKNINCFSFIFIRIKFFIIKLNISCFRFCCLGFNK